jgi:large subunit ribosomal protein L30
MMAEMTPKQIRVTQTASPIGRHRRQRANLIGLGLNKIGRSRIQPDTPTVRGRIAQVHHLVRVEVVAEAMAAADSAGVGDAASTAAEAQGQ